jgi:hypothetical protein
MKKLPLELIQQSLEISSQSPSGLRWKARPLSHFFSMAMQEKFNRDKAYKAAGSFYPKRNYWRVKIQGLCYPAHRIVFALQTGTDPFPNQIDHKDGNSSNNNPNNLRLADSSTNGMNRLGKKNTTSRYKGVCYIKRLDRWRASISKKGMKRKYLGHFKSEIEARNAYINAVNEIHGEFARFEVDDHLEFAYYDSKLGATVAPLSELNNIPSK